MSSVLTYDKLEEQIMNYLNRTDEATLNTIPTFVLFAQDRISRDCKILGVQSYYTSNFTPGQSIVPKPANWLNTLSCSAGEEEIIYPAPVTPEYKRKQILLRSYEFCNMYWPNRALTGFPKYFSDYQINHWIFVPTPELAYPFEICFMGMVPYLDKTNQTNWFTQFAPSVLFRACMLEAMIYLQNDSKVAEWTQLYEESRHGLMNEDSMRITDRYSDRRKD